MSFKQYQIIETGKLEYTWNKLAHHSGDLFVDYQAAYGHNPYTLYKIGLQRTRSSPRCENELELISIYMFNTNYRIISQEP